MFEYYADGNLMAATDPGQRRFSFTYDSVGHLASVTDALNHQTSVTLDELGRLTAVRDAVQALTTTTYDANGNRTSITNELQHGRFFTYDAFDRVETMTDALGHTATNTYNINTGAGRLASRTDRNGDEIMYQRNVDGQLQMKTLPGNDVTQYTYDGFGHLATAENASAKLTFTYDLAGRQLSAKSEGTSTAPRPTVTHAYTYDNQGKRLSVSGPEGTLSYVYYDANDLLHTLTDYAGDEFLFHYDSLNRPVLIERPNEVADQLTYDASDNLLSRDASDANMTLVGQAEYTYNDGGWRSSLTDLDGVHSYALDAAGQLTAATHPAASGLVDESYSYDLVGNRTDACGPNSYNANEQLLCDATYAYTYDNEGNVLSRTLRNDSSVVTGYAWDAEHHLKEVVLPDGSHVTYRYDPLGNRIEIAHGGDVKRYVYDGSVISAEYDGSNSLIATYVHTAPQPQRSEAMTDDGRRHFDITNALESTTALTDTASIADAPAMYSVLEMQRAGQRYFQISDGSGSVTALTDMAGAVIERDRYDTYGNLIATGSAGNPFTFTGLLRDAATGLYHMPLRSYDPTTGRFISEDPLLAVNPYRYASNDPVEVTDPSGAADLWEYSFMIRNRMFSIAMHSANHYWKFYGVRYWCVHVQLLTAIMVEGHAVGVWRKQFPLPICSSGGPW